jgi:transcriptional regulator GlxA family with amidase domain
MHKILAMARVHDVAVLAPHGVVAFDLAIPCQVLAFATVGENASRYRVTTCATVPGPVQSSNGFFISCDAGPERALDADTVVVPGTADNGTIVYDEVTEILREAAGRGARVVSICTGAFALAAAGLLDGRRATTHWAAAARLAADHPEVDVDPRALYVEDGPVITSAGLAAGIDMCLHLVRQDHGAEVANVAARRMVVAPHRAGGQAQFAERPVAPVEGRGLDATRTWMTDHLAEPLTLDRMAAHAQMSTRSFSRHFVAETGVSPVQWLLAQRVQAAQTLLETSDLDVESVAGACGFGSATSLRQHFRQVTSTTPLAYRRTFRSRAADSERGARRPRR